MTHGLVLALAAVLTATLTAGSCRAPDPSADEPTPDISYEDIGPTAAGSDDPHNRQNVVPVPKGTSPRAVEFADANTGYALFSSCVNGQPCQVGLVVTLDGGMSWVSRKLPFDDASEVELRLGRNNTLLLRAVPGGWFVSKDSGRTFQLRPLTPAPAEVNLAEPRYAVGCGDGSQSCPPGQLTEVGDDGKRVPLPGHPAGTHTYTSLVAQADGKLWLSAQATDKGAVLTVTVWTSTDHGRTWQQDSTAQPQQADVEPHLVVAPDGADVWLVAGRYAARRGNGAWTEATAMREVAEVLGAEVLPGGALLVASNQGVWVLDLTQRVRDQGARVVFRLRRLSDGMILGYPGQQSGEVWLCEPHQRRCEWSRVAVTAR